MNEGWNDIDLPPSALVVLFIAFVLFLIFVGLGGCATPRVEYREVKVPVPVVCRPPAREAPKYEADSAPIEQDIFEWVRTLLIDREQRKKEDALKAADLKGCTG